MAEPTADGPEIKGAERIRAPLSDEQRARAARILARETTRTRMLITLSLPVCLLLCIALAAGMEISSLYIVSGGAVAGLLLWGLLISRVPLGPGSAGHRIFIAGDRSKDDDELMSRFVSESPGTDAAASEDAQQ